MSAAAPTPWQPPDARMRLSDDEREVAARELNEHFAAGRLTVEEHSDRIEEVWRAKTRGEIPGLFSDLPSPFAPPRTAPSSAPSSALSSAPSWASRPASLRGVPGPGGRRGNGRGMVRGRTIPGPLLFVLVVLGVLFALANLPLIVVGLIIWFLVSKHAAGGRSGCGSRQAGPPRHW